MSLLYTTVGAIEPKTLNSYIIRNVASGTRIDTSRSLTDKGMLHIRPVMYDVSALEGSCEPSSAVCIPLITARRGGTVVSCGIKAEIAACAADHTSEGRLYVEATCPLAGSSVPGEQQQEDCSSLASFVAEVLNGAVDKTKLSIRDGEACWLLYIDLVVLSVDGSLRDVGCAAATKALEMIKLPKSRLPDGTLSNAVSDLFHSVPLAVSFLVVPLPAAVGPSPIHHLIADPCTAEEGLAVFGYSPIHSTSSDNVIEHQDSGLCNGGTSVACLVTIVVNAMNPTEVLRVTHHGGAGVPVNSIKEMAALAAIYCESNGEKS
eukprot:Tbor_TRINITY_DN8410_c0_g1::TRINITY_DN8410_c0_g1_i1::g.5318::m.5318/K12586/RRP43, EXOSC8, OIP2; exosome complex component RRP43